MFLSDHLPRRRRSWDGTHLSEGVLFVYAESSRFDVSMKNTKRKPNLTRIVYERRNHKNVTKGPEVYPLCSLDSLKDQNKLHRGTYGKVLPVICGVYTVQTRAK